MSARPHRFNPARGTADPREMKRKRLLATVQIARKELGLADDDWRAILARLTGHASAAECSVEQLAAVADELRAKGWKPSLSSPQGRVRLADHPAAKKARALWISLHQLGAIDDPSERALEAFGRRQLGVDKLDWACGQRMYKLVEALKAIAERHGWGQKVSAAGGQREIGQLQLRLIALLATKLRGQGEMRPWIGLPGDLRLLAEANRLSDSLSRRDLSAIAEHYGRRLRELRAPQPRDS